ncbi:hypothetical protein Q5752_001289 [Cryptotrichosporon argae]
MFQAKRTLLFLLRTPLVPPASGPAAIELAALPSARAASTLAAGPSRPRAQSRTLSALSVKSMGYEMDGRRYASGKGREELYSDEAGATGAGTDDVAHSDAAFDKNPNPKSSAQGVEQETGKDFTTRSPASDGYSNPPGKQGEAGDEAPLNTGRRDAGKL